MAPRKAHDWEIIASRDAHFGVISSEEFRAQRMNPEAQRRFYASGGVDITRVLDWFQTDVGAKPSGRALDIGCGVGRLAHAMAKVTDHVVGYDVSETMIRIARNSAPDNLLLTTQLPEGPFDWINSYIVFQHIAVREGLALLDTCLSHSRSGTFLSVQFTTWRDSLLPSTSPLSRMQQWLRRRRNRRTGSADSLIQMHDYELSSVMRLVMSRGFERVVLRHTNHDGHHGVWILARRP